MTAKERIREVIDSHMDKISAMPCETPDDWIKLSRTDLADAIIRLLPSLLDEKKIEQAIRKNVISCDSEFIHYKMRIDVLAKSIVESDIFK